GTQWTPGLTTTSSMLMSSGTTNSNSATLRDNAGSFSAARRAMSSLSRTSPDKYSTADTNAPDSGSTKAWSNTASRAAVVSISNNSATRSRSIRLVSSNEIAIASDVDDARSGRGRYSTTLCVINAPGVAVWVRSSNDSMA